MYQQAHLFRQYFDIYHSIANIDKNCDIVQTNLNAYLQEA